MAQLCSRFGLVYHRVVEVSTRDSNFARSCHLKALFIYIFFFFLFPREREREESTGY